MVKCGHNEYNIRTCNRTLGSLLGRENSVLSLEAALQYTK